MNIYIRDVCRGGGKVFFRLLVRDLPDKAYVLVGAYLPNGAEVPSMVFPAGEPNVVKDCSRHRAFDMAIPQLPVDVTIVTHALDSNGYLIAESTFNMQPQRAKWESRLNGKLQRAALENLRNCDAQRTVGRVVFELNDAPTPFEEQNALLGMSLIRGVAYIPCALTDEPPVLHCLNADMNDYPEAFRLWPPRIAHSSRRMTTPLWEISFTIPVPTDATAVVFVARDAKTSRQLPGFDSVEPKRLDELRHRGDYIYGNARWDSRWHDQMLRNRPSMSELALQRAAIADSKLGKGPSFSIIVPLFRTPLDLFTTMLTSVRTQSYENWQLVLVNASPENKALCMAVRDACAADERIVEVQLSENEGITLNTNAGIAVAAGDFIAFMDHDDIIEPDLLYEYANAVTANPKTDMLYCDEDKLSPDGAYVEPFFKPDFDIDLLRSNNYVCHMLCVRVSLLRGLPNRGPEHDGAQDHCLALMAAEKARCVHHVRKVLYHWRQTEGSTATQGNKSYAQAAGRLSVEQHLKRVGLDGCVSDGEVPFTYRVDYVIAGNPLVSIIIPSCDHVDLLDTCLRSIREKTTYKNYEVVVVENNSTQPETFTYYERAQAEFDRLRIVRWKGRGFNYSTLVNFGAKQAKGDYLVLLNNDIEVIAPNWIECMLGLCQRSDVGIVGAQLFYPDDTIQHAGVIVGGAAAEHAHRCLHRSDYGYFALMKQIRQLSAVTAACLMVKRTAYDAVGGFDEDFAVAFNDVDFCLRVGATGSLVLYTPYAQLYHYESVSRGREDVSQESDIRFNREIAMLRQRWTDMYVKGDPHFNPNFDQRSPMIRHYHLLVD